MKVKLLGNLRFAVIAVMLFAVVLSAQQDQPPVVSAPQSAPPSDAVILLGSDGLGQWQTEDGQPSPWKFENGVMTVTKRNTVTVREFGDIQLHLEFAMPDPPRGSGQDRGNSGIYLCNRYEVQILDSYMNETYADGMLGSVYKVAAPLVNASRKPGEWQSYDIVFRVPRFDESGRKVQNAVVTVFLNGVLVQDHLEMPSPTGGREKAPEQKTGPILLQDHSHPVQFRNIWVREL